MERLHKFIASSGYCSRRRAEQLIQDGQVRVNGHTVTKMGVLVNPHRDHVIVAGHVIKQRGSSVCVLFHKPRAYLVTREDPDDRKTIYDLLPKKFHNLKPVGRLDFDSQGLIILTNDGALANRLMHPRFGGEKIYRVKMQPMPSQRQIKRLERGLVIDGYLTRPVTLKVIQENEKSAWYEWTLKEGRNRQIRKLCEQVGLSAKTIIRIQQGPYRLRGLSVGKWKLA